MPYSLMLVGESSRLPDGAWAVLKSGFNASECKLGSSALALLNVKPPSLLLVCEELADMEGAAFLSALRQSDNKQMPVIVLAPQRNEARVLRAFELGADDYLAGVFDPRELVARVEVVLRRRYEALAHWGGELSLGGLEIDPSQRRCRVHGKRVKLMPREFELLEILMRKAGRTLSRAYLLETVWGMSSSADTRAVDVMVSRLRGKLGPRGARLIETVTKLGYCFIDPSED